MENFEYSSLINYNSCLLIVLINNIFDSSDQMERETILKFIPLKKLINSLKDTNILIDLRTEILIFIKKYSFSLCFIHNEVTNKSFPHSNKVISPKKGGNNLNKNTDSKIGFIDKSGDIKIPCKYEYINNQNYLINTNNFLNDAINN